MSSLADIVNVKKLEAYNATKNYADDQEFFSVAGNIGIVDSGTKLLKKGPDGEALGLQMLFEKTGEEKDAKYVHGDIAVNALNEVGIVKLFKDVEGDTIKKGKVSGINDNGDGSFSIMIDTPQGYFPKTFGFSNDPNDRVIKMDKAQVEKYINLGFATKRGKAFKNSNYGDEYSKIIESGVLANLEADFEAGKISNTEVGQASQQLIESLMNATPQSEIDATNNTPIDTSTPKGAVNTQSDGSELPGAKQLAMEDGQFGAPKPEFSYLEKNDVDTIFGSSDDDKKESNYQYYEFQKMLHQRLISKKLDQERGTGKISKTDFQIYKETLKELKDELIAMGGPTSEKVRSGGRTVASIMRGSAQGFSKMGSFTDKQLKDLAGVDYSGVGKKTLEEQIAFVEDQMDQTVYKQNQESSAAKEKAEAGFKVGRESDRGRVKFLQQQLSGNPSLDQETRAAYQQEADDTLARLDNRTPPSEILPTAEELQISDVPATVKEQAAWYQENKGKIKQLGETKANEVRQILEQNNVNSVVDLRGLGMQIGREKAKMVAASMSFTMSGAPGESEETNMSNYIKLHNQIMTGDPSVNTNQAQTTANATDTQRLAMMKYADTLQGGLRTSVDAFTDLLFPATTGNGAGYKNGRRVDDLTNLFASSDDGTRMRDKLRTNLETIHRQAKIRVVNGNVVIPPQNLDAIKNVYGQLLQKAIRDGGGKGIKDRFFDFFSRNNDPKNLGGLLDQVRARVNPSNGKIEDIYFVDSSGKETDGNLGEAGLTALFGTTAEERAIFLSLISED